MARSLSVRPFITSLCSIKQMDGPSCCLAWWLPSTYPVVCFVTKFRYLQKRGYFSLELCPELGTYKISLLHIDHRKMLST